jgi:hypothetical protein
MPRQMLAAGGTVGPGGGGAAVRVFMGCMKWHGRLVHGLRYAAFNRDEH